MFRLSSVSRRAALASSAAAATALAGGSHRRTYATLEPARRPTIGYVTDVEGDRYFFARWVAMSRVVQRDAAGQLELREGCELVYGGDVVDRGDGDAFVLGELLALLRRYPSRVHFVLGNRDVNKMRLAVELSEQHRSGLCAAAAPMLLLLALLAPPSRSDPRECFAACPWASTRRCTGARVRS